MLLTIGAQNSSYLTVLHSVFSGYSCSHVFSSFFDHVERISKADYVPTVTDILTSRIKTSGVSEMEFTIHSTHFKFYILH